MELEPSAFPTFFWELHGKRPFPWQVRLADQVCTDGWPDVIDLPTASGKTASIDVALFALACRDTAPRRIFFVVDRRVVVNEAYSRMTGVAERLKHANGGVLLAVADRLRELALDKKEPLAVRELRGGIYRDETWVRDPLQPTVVTSTVDQVGSRLLFRGYGLSSSAWPIHAGLIGNDSLIFLDEAHCSRAFAQTLRAVRRYRDDAWSEEPVGRSFQVVEMTATPSSPGRSIFGIDDEDREAEYLRQRIRAAKPTQLTISKNRPRDLEKLADKLCEEALRLSGEVPDARRVAVMVNRIATARHAYQRLRDLGHDADLLIGRMRPYDRDNFVRSRLDDIKSGSPRKPDAGVRFVVSTQCLEVGADLDFDILVSECASIDALLQRFGRLNRMGEFGSARGCIVIGAGQVDSKDDPVYGEALAETWAWLSSVAGETAEVDMGIEAPAGTPATVPQHLNDLSEPDKRRLRLEYPDAPVLLPAHLDAWVQTSPQPACDPSVELFLHGPSSGEPDVQVIWRADLDLYKPEEWADVVSLCPPVTAEALAVPISAFRRWFRRESPDPADSDLEGAGYNGDQEEDKPGRGVALLWRGEKSEVLRPADPIRPGSTFILPESAGGIYELGHCPPAALVDCAELARFESQQRLTIRLHPGMNWLGSGVRQRIAELANAEDFGIASVREMLTANRGDFPDGFGRLFDVLADLSDPRLELKLYPDQRGCVLSAKGRVRPLDDDGADETSRTVAVLLEDHLRHVEASAGRLERVLREKTESFKWAARFHDYGKADVRFQALLRNGDMMAAQYAPKPLAKSASFPLTKSEYLARRRATRLPDGFRHELLSLLFAEDAIDGENGRDLELHLISTHHGWCRPFAPVVPDDAPVDVEFAGSFLSRADASERAAHRLDSGLADRFWGLVRKHGWWGLAYYEALFRLADWDASADEAKSPKTI